MAESCDIAPGGVAAKLIGRIPFDGVDAEAFVAGWTGGDIAGAADCAGGGVVTVGGLVEVEVPTPPPPTTGMSGELFDGRAGEILAEAIVIVLTYRLMSTVPDGAAGGTWGIAIDGVAGVATRDAWPRRFAGPIGRDGLDTRDAGRMVVCGRIDGVPASWMTAGASVGIDRARLDTGQMASRFNAEGRNGRNLRGGVMHVSFRPRC